MTTGNEWGVLPLSSSEKLPSLLYRFSKTTTGFSLDITDLLQIWQTIYTRQGILRQAARSKTSIDPNEDASQLEVLISKIEECLAGAGKSTLSFKVGDAGRPGSFCMKGSIALPAPLSPLEWEFDLEVCSQQVFTSEIVTPIVEAQALSFQWIESLKSTIEQKDIVIAKLLDKIEGSAVDLGSFFPGLIRVGKRGISVQQATRAVPGLSRFDYEEWQQGSDFQAQRVQAARSLVKSYNSLYPSKSGPAEDFSMSAHPNWVTKLAKNYTSWSTSAKELEKSTQPHGHPTASDTDETVSDDDDFESQAASLEHEHPATLKERSENSSTSESPLPPREGRKRGSAETKAKKIGSLGGKSPKIKSDIADRQSVHASTSSDTHPQSRAEQHAQQETEDRASASTDDHDRSPAPKKSQTTGKSAIRLGAIGGRKKQQSEPRSPSPLKTHPEKSATPTPTKAKTKLGAIGGHKSRLPERTTTSPDPHTPPKRKVAETSTPSNAKHVKEAGSKDAEDARASQVKAPVETEEERADRKRNELKSKLERGPTQKKKRKF